jgi:hypothetical protein
MKIYLFTSFVYTNNSPAIQSVYASTGGGYNHPSSPQFHEGRIANNSGIEVFRSIFSRGEFGAGEIRFGLLEVVNNDGALDDWLTYGWGRCAELSVVDADEAYNTRQIVLSACIESLTPSSDIFSLQWTPRYRPLLDKPVSKGLFAGDNFSSPSTGLEGAEDIKGERKPRAKGKLKNISPVMVNAAERVFAWNYDKDGNRDATHSIDAVYFNGSPWTFHNDFADADALISGHHNGVGHYSTCKAESLILMGGTVPLNGTITMDVTIEANASDRYAGALLEYFMEDAGIPSANIYDSDVASLNSSAPYEIGIYMKDESYIDVCDKIAASVAAWYMPDRFGMYRMGQVTVPSGTEDVTFKRFDIDTVATSTEFELINIQPVPTSIDYIPAREVRVLFQRNWTPLDRANIAGAVTDQDIQFFTSEWRTTDPIVNTVNADKHLNAQVLTFETCLYNESDAEAMRAVFAAIYEDQRREYDVEISYNSNSISLIDIGNIVKIVYPKLGMSSGKKFNIHGVELNVLNNIANIKLWG